MLETKQQNCRESVSSNILYRMWCCDDQVSCSRPGMSDVVVNGWPVMAKWTHWMMLIHRCGTISIPTYNFKFIQN